MVVLAEMVDVVRQGGRWVVAHWWLGGHPVCVEGPRVDDDGCNGYGYCT